MNHELSKRSRRQAQQQGLHVVRGQRAAALGEPVLQALPVPVVSEPLGDKALVQRAQKGDAIAFSELVTRHYRRAVRVAFGLLRDKHDAEDCVQEAFARVHKRLPEFEGASAFYTWLYRIVVNLSIDTLRRRRRERRIDVEDESAREALRQGSELWPRYNEADPGEAAERTELAKKLAVAFNDLPEIHQAVLLLRELEGLSYEEIAITLHIKKGTVMSRLFHARRNMQERLEKASESQRQVHSPARSPVRPPFRPEGTR